MHSLFVEEWPWLYSDFITIIEPKSSFEFSTNILNIFQRSILMNAFFFVSENTNWPLNYSRCKTGDNNKHWKAVSIILFLIIVEIYVNTKVMYPLILVVSQRDSRRIRIISSFIFDLCLSVNCTVLYCSVFFFSFLVANESKGRWRWTPCREYSFI